MSINKLHNEYAAEVGGDVFEKCPKAVFAAIAVSALTLGGDYLEETRQRVIAEWWALHDNGIVPQKPPFPRPVGGAA
jgi:hypothetical protein